MHVLHRIRFWLLWPGLFLYFISSRRARIVIRSGNEILFVQDRSKVWFDDDRWTVPGGGMKRAEKPAVSASRELKEELGIIADHKKMQLLWDGKISEYGLRYHAYFFLLEIPEPIEATLQVSEIAAAKWFSIGAIDTDQLKLEGQKSLELLASLT
jgi:8-oxo-dGTP pyrophosphatase MutT (NUDIX family)